MSHSSKLPSPHYLIHSLSLSSAGKASAFTIPAIPPCQNKPGQIYASDPMNELLFSSPILSLTLAAPPIGEQLVAAGAGAAVGAWDVHALVDAELPSLVQPVHFTLVHV